MKISFLIGSFINFLVQLSHDLITPPTLNAEHKFINIEQLLKVTQTLETLLILHMSLVVDHHFQESTT